MLLGHLLIQSGYRAAMGGNIGTPLVSFVNKVVPYDVLVVEVSSFQLDTIKTLFNRPSVSLLNITPDHLDRYDDFAAYAASKGRMFENQQTAEQYCNIKWPGSSGFEPCQPKHFSAKMVFVCGAKRKKVSTLRENRLIYKTITSIRRVRWICLNSNCLEITTRKMWRQQCWPPLHLVRTR